MNVSTEALIVLGLFGFYLYDSLILLQPREMILSCSSDRYALSSPYPYLTIRERIPYLPNPLLPHRTLFRLSWTDVERGAAPHPLDDALRFARVLRPLGVLTSITALLLLVGLPLLLMNFGLGRFFLAALVAAYGVIVAMLVVVHVKRAALGLTSRDIAALAFDALACPPFAINLVRKLGLRQSLTIDPLEIAATRIPRHDAAILWRSIKRRLDDELAQLQDDSDVAVKLQSFTADLEGKMT